MKQIQATSHAFAAILADGSVVAWGAADRGGDSAAVRDQLKGVKQIQATSHAFAAILADGSVVAWGAADRGGDSSAVRDQLKGVKQLQSTRGAFAAEREDSGADCSAAQKKPRLVWQFGPMARPELSNRNHLLWSSSNPARRPSCAFKNPFGPMLGRQAAKRFFSCNPSLS